MKIRCTEDLIEHLDRGHRVKYVCFWGHQKPRRGVSKSCFSQWYDAGFEVDGTHYPTAEHFMMAGKARLFSDQEMESRILATRHPGAAKKLGRQVTGFEAEIWVAHRYDLVVRGNSAKFSQHPALGSFLERTGERVLVEASPRDRIWGIGLAADDPVAEDPSSWRGLNLLGFALMEVRAQLQE